jgi:hypothetical protein
MVFGPKYGPCFIVARTRDQLADVLQLNKSLEKCMASVNTTLIRHKLLLALDDRGKLSCHKVRTYTYT